MSKKTVKAPRVSQKEARRLEIVRQRQQRNYLIGGVIAVAVIGLAVLVYVRLLQPDVEGVVRYGTQAQTHDENVVIAHNSLPPVGGTHSPTWQNCGIYTEPVESKYAIHSMEHGAVWIAYHPDLPEERVAALQDLVRGQSYILMSPYPDLAGDVVMTAWSLQLVIDSVPDERIEEFISRYRQGPQTPERGALCTGGVGSPTG